MASGTVKVTLQPDVSVGPVGTVKECHRTKPLTR